MPKKKRSGMHSQMRRTLHRPTAGWKRPKRSLPDTKSRQRKWKKRKRSLRICGQLLKFAVIIGSFVMQLIQRMRLKKNWNS